jgi:hypothetical protein
MSSRASLPGRTCFLFSTALPTIAPAISPSVRVKLKQAILYIERNTKLVQSITSFPYFVNSL